MTTNNLSGNTIQVFALPGSVDVAAVQQWAEKQAKTGTDRPGAPEIFLVEVPAKSRRHFTPDSIRDALEELDESSRRNRFTKVGDTWDFSYDEIPARGVKNAKGLAYIQYLLAHQNKWITLNEFVAAVEPPPFVDTAGKADTAETEANQDGGSFFTRRELHCRQELLDSKGRTEMIAAKEDLEQTLADSNNFISAAELEKARQHLAMIKAVLGDGKHLLEVEESRSRERKRLFKLIHDAIWRRIAPHHQVLAEHLDRAIDTGWNFRYHPEQPQKWATNFQPIMGRRRRPRGMTTHNSESH